MAGLVDEDTPFGHDVFVLSHHPRADLPMGDGTTFPLRQRGAA
jgi:hypothetical protein